MIGNIYSFLETGSSRYEGRPDDAVRFMLSRQLLDKDMWEKFIGVFREDSDRPDDGWRCEFWGKTMRGGCLTYMYTGDEELYGVLCGAMEGLLDTQRPNGAFSTYPQDDCWRGWDVWGRKYVLTGMIHFYRICKDEDLKRRVLSAAVSHAERLFDEIGDGKISITDTSDSWGGVNSCSILEPVVELYKLTNDRRCLDFAGYIVSSGGCRDGDLVRLAAEDRISPYEYPENKAYETISFFEGLLAMYEVTEDPFYLDTVEKFASAVMGTDITAIGCAGCTHELFDHSAIRQTVFSDGIMQETCVTVTWMRFCTRLFMLTGREKYIAQAERSAWNALYGAINENMLKHMEMGTKEMLDAMPFDSYSPLVNQKRGRGLGGLKYFRGGGFYGCCACIASAGTALPPLTSVMSFDGGIIFNSYMSGSVKTVTPSGNALTIGCRTSYPADMDAFLTVDPDTPERFEVKLRIPRFVRDPVISINGEPVYADIADGYITLDREWSGDTISVTGEIDLETEEMGGMTAFRYGPLALARDARKEIGADLGAPLALAGGPAKREEPVPGETVRFTIQKEGGGHVVLTDYASCGKRWDRPDAAVSVWHKII